MLCHSVVFLEIFYWFNQLCWAKIHYSTYNFLILTFLYFFSWHTILRKNTLFYTQKQKQKLRKKHFSSFMFGVVYNSYLNFKIKQFFP